MDKHCYTAGFQNKLQTQQKYNNKGQANVKHHGSMWERFGLTKSSTEQKRKPLS